MPKFKISPVKKSKVFQDELADAPASPLWVPPSFSKSTLPSDPCGRGFKTQKPAFLPKTSHDTESLEQSSQDTVTSRNHLRLLSKCSSFNRSGSPCFFILDSWSYSDCCHTPLSRWVDFLSSRFYGIPSTHSRIAHGVAKAHSRRI